MERKRLTTAEEFEQAKQELEAYLSGAVVGEPKFMAFWDLVDLEGAEIELNRAEAWKPPLSGPPIFQVRVALAEGRISTRSSEIPGYYKSSTEIKGFVDILNYSPASFKPLEYLGRLRDTLAR